MPTTIHRPILTAPPFSGGGSTDCSGNDIAAPLLSIRTVVATPPLCDEDRSISIGCLRNGLHPKGMSGSQVPLAELTQPMLLSACTDRVSGKVHPDRRLSIAQRLHRRERCRLAASHVRPPRSCSKYPFHDPAHKGGDDLLSFQTLPADHQGITDRPQFAAAARLDRS